MKKIALCAIFLLLSQSSGIAEQIYLNTFDDRSSLDDFERDYWKHWLVDPPRIDNGQLRIDSERDPLTFASGRLFVYTDISSNSPHYNGVLADASGLVVWGFNIRNQDGLMNNIFSVSLANTWPQYSTHWAGEYAHGYRFRGGGLVGNRMILTRHGDPPRGGSEILIDITNGLAPGQYGSFKVVYDPITYVWSLYGLMGEAYVDPLSVSNLLGSAVSSDHTTLKMPFMGVMSGTTGSGFFDNLSLSVPARLLADIEVNGSDEDIVVNTRRVSPSIRFNPGPHSGKPVKWWVFVRSPRSWHYFDYKAWAWRSGAGVTLNDAEAATLPETILPDYRPSSGGLHTFIFMALAGEGSDRVRVIDSVNVRFRRGR